MKLEVLRFSNSVDSTSGLLFLIENHCNDIDGSWDGRKFLAYTLEDEYRKEKVYGETRIPEGVYELQLRTTGGYHQKYKKRFPNMHIGMLHVTNVPNFDYILIHCGNTDEHTAGCLLVGDSQENNQNKKDGFIGKSTQAYKRIYPDIAKALKNGESVTIEYKDFSLC